MHDYGDGQRAAYFEGDPFIRKDIGASHWHGGPGKTNFIHPSGNTVKFMALPTPKIRSADIRQLCREGKSCRYLTPEPVYIFIKEQELYTHA